MFQKAFREKQTVKKKHIKQIEAFESDSRFKFILAGRRGGKTHMVIEDIVKTLFSAPYGASILVMGPSNPQAKELYWSPIEKRLIELGWNFEAKSSQRRFELTRKRRIYIFGAEKVSRVRGHAFYKAYLDEIAFFTKGLSEVWKAVRPTLSDFQGGAIISTTPNGKGTDAYDFFMDTLKQPSWKYFHWKTIDNPYISDEEIGDAERELDEKSFSQEYLATWESFEGLAYYQFDENLHIKKQPHIDVKIPLHLVFDFNVNPTTLLLSQFESDMLRYKKEYSFKNSSTEQTVKSFCEDFKSLQSHLTLKIRGDSSGKNRSSTTGRSDYEYVEEILGDYGFSYQLEIRSSNPPIIDRVKYVNGWLKPFKGPHRIEIDPSCEDLIRDLSSQKLNGRFPSDANNMGHKADALGYDVFWQKHNLETKRQGTVEL